MIGRLGVYPPVTSGRQEEASQAGHLVPVLNYKFPPSMTGGRTGDLHSDMLLLLPGTSSSIPSCLERNKIFSPSHPLRSFVREFTLRLGIFLTDEAYGIGREKKKTSHGIPPRQSRSQSRKCLFSRKPKSIQSPNWQRR